MSNAFLRLSESKLGSFSLLLQKPTSADLQFFVFFDEFFADDENIRSSEECCEFLLDNAVINKVEHFLLMFCNYYAMRPSLQEFYYNVFVKLLTFPDFKEQFDLVLFKTDELFTYFGMKKFRQMILDNNLKNQINIYTSQTIQAVANNDAYFFRDNKTWRTENFDYQFKVGDIFLNCENIAQLAAFFGSYDCFIFFVNNDQMYANDSLLTNFAIAGGNPQIIAYIDKTITKDNYKEMIIIALEFHRYNVVDYLTDKFLSAISLYTEVIIKYRCFFYKRAFIENMRAQILEEGRYIHNKKCHKYNFQKTDDIKILEENLSYSGWISKNTYQSLKNGNVSNKLMAEKPSKSFNPNPQKLVARIKSLEAKNKQYYQQILNLRRMNLKWKSRCEIIKAQKEKSYVDDYKQQIFSNFPSKTAHMLETSSANANKGRKKQYDEEVKAFWLEYYSLFSEKQFRKISADFMGPAYSTVQLWIKEADVLPMEYFLDSNKIQEVTQWWLRHFGINSLVGSFTTDACKIDEDIVIKSDGTILGLISENTIEINQDINMYKENIGFYYNLIHEAKKRKELITHAFIISICPFSMIRPFPIHINFTNSGSPSQEFYNLLQKIPEILGDVNCIIKYCGTDGDPKYNLIQNDNFDTWSRQYENGICDISNIVFPELFFTNDPFHIIKRIRKRLINNMEMQLCYNGPSIGLKDLLEIADDIPNSALSNNTLTTMDDFYPFKIYRPKYFLEAYRKQNYPLMLLLSLGTIINIITRSKTATRKDRIILAHMGMFISLLYYSNIRHSKPFKGIFSEIICKHCANYFVAVIKILGEIDDNFPLDRIGSMIAEHLFARIREEAKADQKIQSFLEAFKRIIIITSFDKTSVSKIGRRWFDSGIAENGKVILDNETVIATCCFAASLFGKCGIDFSAECAFFNLSVNTELSDTDCKSFMDLFSKEDFTKKSMERDNGQEKWELHISQCSRSYGRNVIMRYSFKNDIFGSNMLFNKERPMITRLTEEKAISQSQIPIPQYFKGSEVKKIVNLGNTCFLNVALQILLCLQPLKTLILKESRPSGIIKLFKELYEEKKETLRPIRIIQKLPRILPQYQRGMMYDASECLETLLIEIIKNVPEISDLFTIEYTQVETCSQCGQKVHIDESRTVLNIEVPMDEGVFPISDLIKDCCKPQEAFVKRCLNCKSRTLFNSNCIFSYLPPIFLVKVEQFYYLNSVPTIRSSKIDTSYIEIRNIPGILDTNYYLFCIVEHAPVIINECYDPNLGHYLIYLNIDNNWRCISDDQIIDNKEPDMNSINGVLFGYIKSV